MGDLLDAQRVTQSIMQTFQMADQLKDKYECVCLKLLAVEQYRQSFSNARKIDPDVTWILDTLRDTLLSQIKV